MEAPPFIARREGIDGMKKRIIVLTTDGNGRKDNEKNDSGAAQCLDNHTREQSQANHGYL